MQAGADILHRLQRAALRRRARLWLAMLAPWCVLLAPAGAALCLAWAAWDYRRLERQVQRNWTRWIDAAVPGLEDSSALLDQASTPLARLQRARLLRRLTGVLREDVLASVVHDQVRFDRRYLAASLMLALALAGWRLLHSATATPAQVAARAEARIAADTSAISVRVTPPYYTGVAASTAPPGDLQVPEFSTVEWCLKAPQPVATPVELSDGQLLPIGRQCARWEATTTLFWRWRGQRYQLRVIADAAPQMALSAPATLAMDAATVPIDLTVRDDYRVKRAVLHLTVTDGSGDELRFTERELALPESGDARTRSWNRQWSLEELGIEPGKELYFYLRATDNAERAHTVLSPIHVLRWAAPLELTDPPGPPVQAEAVPDRQARAARTADLAGVRSVRRVQGPAIDPVARELRALLVALSDNGALPDDWTRVAHEAIRNGVPGDDARLAAQRVLQDVADGCLACRPQLRAWLRGAMPAAPPRIQPDTVAETPFMRAWRTAAP